VYTSKYLATGQDGDSLHFINLLKYSYILNEMSASMLSIYYFQRIGMGLIIFSSFVLLILIYFS
jgi:hypothetical protein